MKRKYLLLLAPLSIIMLLAAKASPFVAEYLFARGLFKIISIPIGFVTGLVPYSIAELLIYTLPWLFLFFCIRFVMQKRKKELALNLGIFFSVMLFLFVSLCGTNYYRYEFQEYCTFKVREYSSEELYELCEYLAEKCNETKVRIENVDKNGVVVLDDFSEVADEAASAYRELSKTYPVLKYCTGRAKPVLASHYMSYTGIVGIYIPFTAEANVNDDVADYNRPADTCHELAHLHGFMREDEANFISYLACIASKEAYFQYSGYMMGLIYATNALYGENVSQYREIFSALTDEVKADLRYEDEYWDNLRNTEAYQTVEAASDKVNDTYLKINGQKNGVKSYGEMVDLLLAQYLSEKDR